MKNQQISESIELYLTYLNKYRLKKIATLNFQYKKNEYNNSARIIQDYNNSFLIYEEDHYFEFETNYEMPSNINKNIFIIFDMQGEAKLYINQELVYGLDYQHKEYLLRKEMIQGTNYHISVILYSGRRIPSAENSFRPFSKNKVILSHRSLIDDYPIRFNGASIFIENQEIKELFYDIETLVQISNSLESNNLRKYQILYDLYKSLLLIDMEDLNDESIEKKVMVQISECRQQVKYILSRVNSQTIQQVFLIGHAHIDYAWLWQKKEAIFKMEKTYSTVLELVDHFPDFKFLMTQALYSEIMSNRNPKLFSRIKKLGEQGNLEVNGSCYVEMDCNLPSGESLIRQILYGLLVTKEFFPAQTNYTLWLPDAFGFSGTLPQILVGFGLKYLVTGKLIWNDTSTFPYDKFIWRGIDGTSIFVYILTGKMFGYNGKATVPCIKEAWENVQHKELQHEILFPVGMGDGGGGPTFQDLEYSSRLGDVEGFSRTKWENSNIALGKIFSNSHELPEYKGELYFERHRGTYTTQAAIKWWNRRLEFLLRETEFIISLNRILSNEVFDYSNKLRELWKRLLENQFHDIICGVCISPVYQVIKEEFQQLKKELIKIITEEYYKYFLYKYKNKFSGDFLVSVNTYNWVFNDLIIIKAEAVDGSLSIGQKTINLDNEEIVYIPVEIKPLSQTVIQGGDNNNYHLGNDKFKYKNNILITPYYTIKFDDFGNIISIKDSNNKIEFVGENSQFNAFQLYEDIPAKHDAWDVNDRYLEKELNLVKSERLYIVTDGEYFIQLRRKVKIGYKSEATQDLFLYSHNNRIDFKTKIDWNESHKLLKVKFGLNLDVDVISFDTQFGHIDRSTGNINNLDNGKFEVTHHKWICAKDNLKSICILNDSKYGCSFDSSNYYMTLLRSSKAPDENADNGTHYMTYSFLPERNIDKIVQEAYILNNAPLVFSYKNKKFKIEANFNEINYSIDSNQRQLTQQRLYVQLEKELIKTDNSQIIMETMKLCEQDEKSIILRFYNSCNTENKLCLQFGFVIEGIFETNLMEEDLREIENLKEGFVLLFRKFEIKTIKIKLK